MINLSVFVSPIYLIGPLLYWYVRSVLTDRSKLVRSDIWHFLPMAVYFISASPNMLVPWDEKVAVARMVVENQAYMMEYKSTLLSYLLPAVFIYVFRLILVLGYTIWSIVLIGIYIRKKESTAVFVNQQFIKKWLFVLTGFTLILVVSQIFRVIQSFEIHFSDLFFAFNILRLVSVIGLAGLLISPFFFPSVLYGMPRMPEARISQHKGANYNRSNLEMAEEYNNNYEIEYLNFLDKTIEACMQEKQPYLQKNFNLAYLSAMIQIPVHHLAYFFREVKKEHFIDYRNRWRIKHAKNMIQEGKSLYLTLEAIGLSSGFSNRNAFRDAFKKFEGTSPVNFTSHTEK